MDVSPAQADEKTYRQTINAWAMYDWGNSAFATTVMAAVFPPFYRSLVTGADLGEAAATSYWAYTTSFALFLVALLGPILGAIADYTGGKKYYIGFFAALGITATALFVFLGDDTYIWGSILFTLGNIGFAGGNIFYESLLPHIARQKDINQVSTRGYAMGYVGGGILLVINMLWIMYPDVFYMPGVGFALRASFFSVAVWWAVFAIPLFRRVPSPPAARPQHSGDHPIGAGFRRLYHTARQLPRYRQLLVFLFAFWIYNDGIGTIIKMSTAYGDQIGLQIDHMIAALVLSQFVGIPCTFAFGWLARYTGAKKAILLGLAVYIVTSTGAYFMTNTLHFFILAGLIGVIQGGTQGLSRSLFASMVPQKQATEFFGFFSTSSKFAGIFGPLLFGLVNDYTGGGRISILSLIAFFAVGGLVLLWVDEEEGARLARQEDAAAEA